MEALPESDSAVSGAHADSAASGVAGRAASVLGFVALMVLASYLTARVSDPRHFFHLSVGNWILAQSQFPKTDVWTTAGNGIPWVTDSWLYDTLLSKTETVFGWPGIAALAILSTALFVVALGFLYMKSAGNPVFGFLVTILVACGTLEQQELSPELVSFGLLAVASFFLVSPVRPIFKFGGIFVSGLFLANVHAAFLLLPFFVLFLSRDALKTRLSLAGVSLLSGIFTPSFGLQIVQWLKALAADFQLSVRFQDTAANVYLFSFSFLVLLWILIVLLVPRDKHAFPSSIALLAGILTTAGLPERAMIPYALLPTGLLLACCLRYWSERNRSDEPQLVDAISKLEIGIKKIPAAGAIWLLFCIGIVNYTALLRQPVVDAFLPRRAMDFYLENRLPGPLLHESVVGPYVAYRFQASGVDSKERAMVDHRLPLFSLSQAISERAMKNLQPGWDELLKKYQPKSILVRKSTPLFEVFSHSQDWEILYDDADEVAASEEIEKIKPPPSKEAFGWAIFCRRSA